MRYCVEKNTTKVIDGSENPIDIMLQNALNAGFSSNEVEILSEDEYQSRLIETPQPPSTDERLEAVESAILAIMEVLG